jgi:hypothetical protein
MTTAYTSLLGLALPVTGELSGTWGDTVNNGITSLLDSSIAGTTTLSTDADVTLTTTTGAANTSREAILLWTAGGTATRTITAPAQSKIYTVINASSSTQSIKLVGVGPTAGVTIIKGESALCAWNGSDFIKISNTAGAGVFSSITNSGLTSGRVVYSTTGGLETDSANLLFDGTTLTANNITSAAATNLLLKSAGTTAVTIDTSQNVGIGTSSPTQRLEVRTATDKITQILSGAGSAVQWQTLNDAKSANVPLAISTLETYFYTNGTERMRIDSSGNVGIGTSSPSGRFDAQNNQNGTSNFYFRNTDTTNTSSRAALNVIAGAQTLGFLAINADNTFIQRTSGNLQFQLAGSTQATIDSSGNLLVGTTSFSNAANKGLGVQWSSATGNGGEGGSEFRNTSTSTNSDSNPALIIIKGSTTYTSSQRFIQFNANAGSQAMGGIVGNGATNAQFISLSDARDKDNIQTITGSLNKITSLNPVEFDWKQTGEHINAGFIAQEVELVFPEYVVDNVANAGQEERKGLTGGMSAGFVAHLVKAIQEQQVLITSLTTRLTALEAK